MAQQLLPPIATYYFPGDNPFPPFAMEETQRLISDLCQAVSFAHDIQACYKKTGGNNHAILFTCIPFAPEYSGKRIGCVLRTVKKNWFMASPGIDSLRIKPLVALMNYLRINSILSVPLILSYDCTNSNRIQSPYVILERVSGHTLEFEYNKLLKGFEHANDLTRRCNYAKSVAEIIVAMERTSFSAYGAFSSHGEMLDKGTGVDPKFVLGTFSVAGFEVPPESDFSTWVRSLVIAQLKRIERNPFGVSSDEKYRIGRLETVFIEMAHQGLFIEQPSVLSHPDFFPRNIMVKSTDDHSITGLIDWDGVKALPRIMTRRPPDFLWNHNVDLPIEEKLTIRRAFFDELEKFNPGSGYYDDAYSVPKIMLRALCMYVMNGPFYAYHGEMSYLTLTREWEVRKYCL